MSSSHYTIRNYTPADFDDYALLSNEAAKFEPAGPPASRDALRETLNRPGYCPGKDVFIIETAGSIVGYMDITPEQNIRRVILRCFILPEHRRQGLSARLLGCAVHRAEDLKAEMVHVNIQKGNNTAKIALSRSGFKSVRRYLQMRMDISRLNCQDTGLGTLRYLAFQQGDEEKLAHIQNRAFTGSWGYNPNTVEEIRHCIKSSGRSPEGVVLACDGGNVIGYCWTKVIREGNAGDGTGQVFMLGVDPDYRGRGLGKGILIAGLSHLQSKGFQVAELTVDQRNKAACSLYRSLGFKVRTSSVWYEKRTE